MKLYATIENEKGKREGVGSNEKLTFELRVGNKKLAVGEVEEIKGGIYLYITTTLGQIGEGYEALEDQCIDYFITEKELKGKKQKGEKIGLNEKTYPQILEDWENQ